MTPTRRIRSVYGVPIPTLREVPARLHRRLEARATSNGRTLEQEVLSILTGALAEKRIVHPESLIEESREFRRRLDFVVTPEEIDRHKREGRK